MAEQNKQPQNNQKPEQDVNQLLKVRREKLAALQEAGKDPFQITRYDQTHHTDEAKELYIAHARFAAGHKAVDMTSKKKGYAAGR